MNYYFVHSRDNDRWDGETIVSERFVEIYNKYNLKGLDFIPLPKSPALFPVTL